MSLTDLETSSLHSLVHETTTILTTSVLVLQRDMLPISQEDYLVHEATNYRLLQYSIFGWDKLPISKEEFLHPWDNELFDYFSTQSSVGTNSPFPKGNFSSMRRQIIDYYGTRSSEGHVPHIPRSFSRPWDEYFDYFGNRSSDGTSSLSPKKKEFSLVRETTIGTRSSDGTSSLSPRT